MATASLLRTANGSTESASLEEGQEMKIFLLWSVTAFLTPAFASVGFQQLSVPDPPGKALSVAVWFPSVGKPVSVSLGPFQQMVVPNGTTEGTKLPLVLISHGTG